jgi:hypothetical protein
MCRKTLNPRAESTVRRERRASSVSVPEMPWKEKKDRSTALLEKIADRLEAIEKRLDEIDSARHAREREGGKS